MEEDINDEHEMQDGGLFTPHKLPSHDPSKFGGVSVKMIPKETDHGEVIDFLINAGLPETHKENVSIKTNGTVMVTNLDSAVCEALINTIHTKNYFGKRLFCNGVVLLTPEKQGEEVQQQQAEQQAQQQARQQQEKKEQAQKQQVLAEQAQQQPGPAMQEQSKQQEAHPQQTQPQQQRPQQQRPQPQQQQPQQQQQTQQLQVEQEVDQELAQQQQQQDQVSSEVVDSVPCPVSPMSPNTFSQEYSETPDIQHLQLSSEELDRRNSMGL